jgi:hypothetical protein
MDDIQQARFGEGLKEKPEESAKAFYDMLSSAQKPLHEKTTVSQLDAIGRIMGLKSQFSMSQDNFDGMFAVFGSLLPKDHCFQRITSCRRTCTSHRNFFVHLRCRMSRSMLVRMDASFLGKITREQHTV